MSLRSYGRALIALSRIVVPLALSATAAGAQTSATVPDDAVRVREGSFPIVDPMALQNWTLDVFARRDGWVEIDFAAIPGRRGALPWLYADGIAGKIGAPVLSRAYFTPEQIRASTRFADSVIDRLLPPDVAAKRFSRGAPTFISMPRGIGKGSLFDMYMFAPTAQGLNLPESIAFGLGGCLDVLDAGPALLGRGATRSVQDFRAMMRALDTAAFFSSQYASPPKPMHADLVNADQAACAARPTYKLERPEYPLQRGDRTADVHVDAVVDTTGRIDAGSTRVVVSGGAFFDSIAVSAVQRWRFKQAVLMTAMPAAQRVHIDIHFAPKPPSAGDGSHPRGRRRP